MSSPSRNRTEITPLTPPSLSPGDGAEAPRRHHHVDLRRPPLPLVPNPHRHLPHLHRLREEGRRAPRRTAPLPGDGRQRVSQPQHHNQLHSVSHLRPTVPTGVSKNPLLPLPAEISAQNHEEHVDEATAPLGPHEAAQPAFGPRRSPTPHVAPLLAHVEPHSGAGELHDQVDNVIQ
jgi:hypothetical protein